MEMVFPFLCQHYNFHKLLLFFFYFFSYSSPISLYNFTLFIVRPSSFTHPFSSPSRKRITKVPIFISLVSITIFISFLFFFFFLLSHYFSSYNLQFSIIFFFRFLTASHSSQDFLFPLSFTFLHHRKERVAKVPIFISLVIIASFIRFFFLFFFFPYITLHLTIFYNYFLSLSRFISFFTRFSFFFSSSFFFHFSSQLVKVRKSSYFYFFS